ncbi:MAG: hypothetical protein GY719_06615, partial [bacterium]|nr:hypothetical protein [bacterium]
SRARLWAPADQSEAIGSDLWTLGGESAELWIESRAELPPLVFNLRNLAPDNRIRVRLGAAEEARDFDQVPPEGVTWRAQLVPERATRVRRDSEGPIYYYLLRVDTRLGEKPKWRLEASGNDYLGLGLLLLGSPEFLARDVYGVEWLGCGAPPSVAAGEEFLAAARLRNGSGHPWPHQGTARVRLSYHWLDAAGEQAHYDGLRTELTAGVEPGEQLDAWLQVQAPGEPGRYLLEVDPVFENVAWFSTRNGGVTCRTQVEVTP